MINELRPYPEYRDSGLPWLGNIPQHWDCLPHRAVFEEIKEQGHVNEPLLSVTIGRGIIRQKDLLADSSKKDSSNLDKSKYKLVEPGDIAYNKMRAWQGALGVSRYRGIVSPAYIVQRLRGALKPDYFHYLFRTPGFAKEAERWSYGITSDQWSLRSQHFKMIYSCVPPIEEQELIVGFLREFNRQVHRFIHNRQRLVEVLNEQKQAIINRAVTRGLDPNAPLKPSGIDWLEDIPEHWEVKPLRQLGRFTKGSGGSREDDVAEGLPCIRYGHLYMYFNFTVSAVRTYVSESRARDYARIKYGDLLFTASGEDMSEIGKSVVNLINEEVCCGGDVIILRPRIDAHPPFLGYASDAWHTRCQKAQLGRGTTIKHIYGDQLKKVCVAVPPKAAQMEIAEYIRQATSEATTLIDRAKREIDLIHEYRTRLISDVVTGKIDVRHLAPPPDGCLWCDAEVARRMLAGTAIGMRGIKKRRMTELTLTSHPQLFVGQCVPFYFCPRSVMLYLISQANHPELAYQGGQRPIVHLEADLYDAVDWAVTNGRRWAFTLSNAGSRLFEDRADLNKLAEIDWKAVQAKDWRYCKDGKQAEFLVEQSFPWRLVERVGVCDNGIRRHVVHLLGDAAHKPPIEIRRDWYY